jgi:hypothetical protein
MGLVRRAGVVVASSRSATWTVRDMIRWLVFSVVVMLSGAAAAQFFPLGLKVVGGSSFVCKPVQKAFKPVVISKTPPIVVC